MTTHTDVEKFLQAVFGSDYATHAIFANLNPPAHARDYRQLDAGRDCYWSIAAFGPNSKTNAKDEALEVRALVIDDVGTKVPAPAVELALGIPTAITTTSAGNYQWAYRLAAPIAKADWGSFLAEVEALVGQKLDGGDAVHLFRLPMGVNTKKGRGAFHVKLTQLNSGIELSGISVGKSGYFPTGPGPSSGILGLEALRELMKLVPNDLDRDGWIEVGHGLKALCADDDDGFTVFDEWSQLHDTYDAAKTRTAWDSFGAGGLKTQGGALRARAEGLDPDKFRQWDVRVVFDDAPPPPPPAGGGGGGGGGRYNPTHRRMAGEVVNVEQGRLGWIGERSGSWGAFDDVTRCWIISNNEAMMHRAVDEAIARRLAVTADAKLIAAMHKAGWHHSVASLVRVATGLRLSPQWFDNNDNLLGMPGWTLEMDASGLGLSNRQGEPWDFITKSTSVRVAPAGARGKYWEKFLTDFTGGDWSLRRWWQVFCGYCLTGHTSEHAVVFVYGPGGNGKSVFLDIIAEVMGTYHERADHRVFMEMKGGKHLAPLAVLEGARLVTVPDVAVGATWDMGLVKQASGGGSITANRMRQDPVTFFPKFKIVMAGNEKPRMDAVDEGVRRRIRLVPALFRPKAVDTGLVDKLRGEKAEILRWMVEGWMAWAAGGLPACQVIDEATKDYLDGADVFGRWVGECLTSGSSKVRVADAFRSWEAFRAADGSYQTAPSTTAQMSAKLKDVGFVLKRDNAGGYIEGAELISKAKTVF